MCVWVCAHAHRPQVLAIVSGFTQREFIVPDNVVGAIMGKGGERIAKLQADTETSVDIKRGACLWQAPCVRRSPVPCAVLRVFTIEPCFVARCCMEVAVCACIGFNLPGWEQVPRVRTRTASWLWRACWLVWRRLAL